MKRYNPNEPLFSIHIPKCAGTSFSNILKKWFGRGFHKHYYDEKRNKPPRRCRLDSGFIYKRPRRGLCIHGHFNNKRGIGLHDYYPEANQLITIIRDPFDLHVSNYFFVKHGASKRKNGSFRSGQLHPIIFNNWSLEDYLRETKKSYICQFLPPDITIDNYPSILEDRFLYIGITEELQKSVDTLADILGFPHTSVPEKNVSEWTETIPNGAKEEFISMNPVEMAIYRYATENYANVPR